MPLSTMRNMKFLIQELLNISILNLAPSQKTVITREYPANWKRGDEPYYAVNNEKNNALYAKYRELADEEHKVIFGGRLGMYKYFDMDDTIEAALECVNEEL